MGETSGHARCMVRRYMGPPWAWALPSSQPLCLSCLCNHLRYNVHNTNKTFRLWDRKQMTCTKNESTRGGETCARPSLPENNVSGISMKFHSYNLTEEAVRWSVTMRLKELNAEVHPGRTDQTGEIKCSSRLYY